MAWYASVRYTLLAALFGAVLALFFGLLGAAARRSSAFPLRMLGTVYTTMVRGIPDVCLLYTSPSPRDATLSRMPSSA